MVTRTDLLSKGHITWPVFQDYRRKQSRWQSGNGRWSQRKPVEKAGFVNGARVK